ncbi:hypothetical protein Ahy_A03g014823 [Arachis hypogaea]|uniref:Uncharacterized protein n=1 Tax=Arachis hypogaea TaxID=3818 RepID=A0A445DYN3_ARAHY|nr:hypothetical protein Ahy_A03g014823 [Arachis hypogaea]
MKEHRRRLQCLFILENPYVNPLSLLNILMRYGHIIHWFLMIRMRELKQVPALFVTLYFKCDAGEEKENPIEKIWSQITIEDVNEVNFIEAEKFPLLHSWFNNFKNVTMIKENFLDMEKMLATIKSIIGKRWNLSDRSHQYMIFASWVGRGVAADAEGGAGEEALGWAVGGGDVVFVTVDPEELAADLKSRMRGTRIRGICYLRHQ